mgnify:CR=1 FL=1
MNNQLINEYCINHSLEESDILKEIREQQFKMQEKLGVYISVSKLGNKT